MPKTKIYRIKDYIKYPDDYDQDVYVDESETLDMNFEQDNNYD